MTTFGSSVDSLNDDLHAYAFQCTGKSLDVASIYSRPGGRGILKQCGASIMRRLNPAHTFCRISLFCAVYASQTDLNMSIGHDADDEYNSRITFTFQLSLAKHHTLLQL